jgi:hypothetical protein
MVEGGGGWVGGWVVGWGVYACVCVEEAEGGEL